MLYFENVRLGLKLGGLSPGTGHALELFSYTVLLLMVGKNLALLFVLIIFGGFRNANVYAITCIRQNSELTSASVMCVLIVNIVPSF